MTAEQRLCAERAGHFAAAALHFAQAAAKCTTPLMRECALKWSREAVETHEYWWLLSQEADS